MTVRAVSLSRLKSILPVAAWLAAAVMAVNVLLHAFSATPLLAWLPKAVSGTGFLEDNKTRVADAFDELKSAPHPLVAIVGISNVREGINLGVLADAASAPDWQFLGLGGAGLGMPDIAEHAQVLLNSHLRPRIVVLGLGLHQLLDPKPTAPAAPAVNGGGGRAVASPGILDYLRRGDLRNTASSARAWLWFFSRRQDVAIAADKAALEVRERLFRLAGVHLPRPRDAASNPFREMIKSGWPDHFSESTLREEEAFLEGLGAFDVSAYQQAKSSPDKLASLINAFEQRGAHVVLLLLPDHPVLQRRIPGESSAPLDRALAQAATSPTVLDFRTLLTDPGGFVDLAHLNRQGSIAFSIAAGRALHERLE